MQFSPETRRRRRRAIFILSLEVESDQTSIACKCLSAKDELRVSIVNDLAFISTMKDVFEPNYIFHSDCMSLSLSSSCAHIDTTNKEGGWPR